MRPHGELFTALALYTARESVVQYSVTVYSAIDLVLSVQVRQRDLRSTSHSVHT